MEELVVDDNHQHKHNEQEVEVEEIELESPTLPLHIDTKSYIDEDDNIRFERGQPQKELKFRDKWWGLFFWLHFAVILGVAYAYHTNRLKSAFGRSHHRNRLLDAYEGEANPGIDAIFANTQDDDDDDIDVWNGSSGWNKIEIHDMVLWSMFVSPLLLSMLLLMGLKYFPRATIRVTIVAAMVLNAVWFTRFLVKASSLPWIVILIWSLLLTYLIVGTCIVWRRIPHAMVQIKVAISCWQANSCQLGGLIVLWYLPLLALVSCLWWYDYQHIILSPWILSHETILFYRDDDVYGFLHTEEQNSPLGRLALLGLFLGLWWTWQVLRNVVTTTIAGIVGVWWWNSKCIRKSLNTTNRNCCQRTNQLFRNVTYRFGSICLGSIASALAETLDGIIGRPSSGLHPMVCIRILQHAARRLSANFHRWAFLYVGLYGYSYMNASKNVGILFQSQGWERIQKDYLLPRLFAIMALSIGSVTTSILYLFATSKGDEIDVSNFLLALFVGSIFSAGVLDPLVSIVDSAIVLWAESPNGSRVCEQHIDEVADEVWLSAFADSLLSSAPFGNGLNDADEFDDEEEGEGMSFY